jgi:hypothetical protein
MPQLGNISSTSTRVSAWSEREESNKNPFWLNTAWSRASWRMLSSKFR